MGVIWQCQEDDTKNFLESVSIFKGGELLNRETGPAWNNFTRVAAACISDPGTTGAGLVATPTERRNHIQAEQLALVRHAGPASADGVLSPQEAVGEETNEGATGQGRVYRRGSRVRQ
jgi:hypothetical protein